MVRTEADAFLLHVPTTAVFGVDALGLAVSALPRGAAVTASTSSSRTCRRLPPARVRAFAAELRKLEMLQPSGS